MASEEARKRLHSSQLRRAAMPKMMQGITVPRSNNLSHTAQHVLGISRGPNPASSGMRLPSGFNTQGKAAPIAPPTNPPVMSTGSSRSAGQRASPCVQGQLKLQGAAIPSTRASPWRPRAKKKPQGIQEIFRQPFQSRRGPCDPWGLSGAFKYLQRR